MMQLEGKTALITGAARGIGRAIAERYAREGAHVAIADLNLAGAEQAAATIGAGSFAVELDVTRQDSIDAAIAAVADRTGRLDILVNNAGVFDMAPTLEITRQSYARLYAVNVEGLLFMTQAAARQMIAQSARAGGRGPDGTAGRIINFASQAGRRGEPLVAIYCSSKAAVISITQSTGLDLIRYGINVNAIAPGVVDNEHWNEVDAKFARYENLQPGEKKRAVAAAVPFGRMAHPEEIAGTAVFLAGPDSTYIVAQTYNVDGGNWMS